MSRDNIEIGTRPGLKATGRSGPGQKFAGQFSYYNSAWQQIPPFRDMIPGQSRNGPAVSGFNLTHFSDCFFILYKLILFKNNWIKFLNLNFWNYWSLKIRNLRLFRESRSVSALFVSPWNRDRDRRRTGTSGTGTKNARLPLLFNAFPKVYFVRSSKFSLLLLRFSDCAEREAWQRSVFVWTFSWPKYI